MYIPESVRKNEMHKILLDFGIQTDHIIRIKRADLISINKKKRTCHEVNFHAPALQKVKIKESDKRGKYFDVAVQHLCH